MGEVINQLNELTKGDAVIVTDVGQHQMVACRYAKFNKSRSNVTAVALALWALPCRLPSAQNMAHRKEQLLPLSAMAVSR